MSLYPTTMRFTQAQTEIAVVIDRDGWRFAGTLYRTLFDLMRPADRLALRSQIEAQVELAKNTPTKGDKLMERPTWTLLLKNEDEWVVRTALANVASDLERVADAAVTADNAVTPVTQALRESAARYRDVLSRIEMADVAEELSR